MKRVVVTLFVLLISFVRIFASAVPEREVEDSRSFKAIYDKYKDSPAVSALYVSESLLKTMVQALGDSAFIEISHLHINDSPDIAPLLDLDKMTGVYILSSDELSTATNLKQDIGRFVAQNSDSQEELLRFSEEGNDITFYYVPAEDSHSISNFLMVQQEKSASGETVIIDKTGAVNTGTCSSITVIEIEAEGLTLSDIVKMTVELAKTME